MEIQSGHQTVIAGATTFILILNLASGWQETPITKRLFTQNHRGVWDVQWGECSTDCGTGEENARAVCVSESSKSKLSNAACHGIAKPVVPARRSCVGDCLDRRTVDIEDHLVGRTEENSTSAVFSPVHCDRSLQSDTGEVTSPDWPMKSVQYLQCRLTVLLPQDKRVFLSFDHFSLEGSPECTPSNYVEIVDVLTNRSEVICGSQSAFTWTADSNQVQIRFSAESSSVFHRFHATYTSIAKARDSDCSAVLDGPMGRYVSVVGQPGNTQPLLCEVLFHAEADSTVVLSFAVFEVLCTNPVTIKDILSEEVRSFCGSQEPFSWTSTGNEAILTYDQPTETSWEVDLEYETLEAKPSQNVDIECSESVSASVPGIITSPGYPWSYPANLNCNTLLQADPGQVITVAFQDFMVEPSKKQNGEPTETCQFDHLTVLDVTTDRADIFCGMHQPFAWTSDSNEVLIVFVSDNSEAYTGYKAKFWSSERPGEPDCLEVTEHDSTVTDIRSLQTPQPYPSNSKCFLNIHLEPDNAFILEVVTFDVEESDGCEKDALELTDMTTRRNGRFCGQLPSFTWTSDSNEIQLSFRSDDMIEGAGFHIRVESAKLPAKSFPQRDCRQRLIKSRGYIRLPLSAGNPPLGNALCLIVITVKPEQRIVMVIDTFAIEAPPTGYNPDFVEVRDVYPHGDGHIERLEGKLPSFTWTSRRNEIAIIASQLSSDIASVRLHGTYHATRRPQQECSRLILDESGLVNWPNDFALNSTDCELTIHTHPLKRIVVTIDKLDLPTDGCQDFSLQVFDVEPGRTLTYCKTQEPFSLISTSNEMRLRFKRTNGGPATAFKRQVSQEAVVVRHFVMERPLQAVEHVAEYHRIFREEEGEFSSLDRSRAIWMTGNCTVLIEVPFDKQILINFQDFIIGEQRPESNEDPVSCIPEFVQVEDVTNGRRSIFCGNYRHFSWLSDTNAVLVTFFTNPVIVYHGFRAKYQTVNRGVGLSEHSSSETGQHQSTNFPDTYPSNHQQSWVIHSPPNHIVSLVVDSFSIEDSESCSKDYVKFEDLSNSFSSKYCGDHGLFAWTSGGNDVIVTMVTDDEVASSGISMVHTWVDVTQGCFQLLRGESGSIKSSEFLQAGQIWRGSCQLIIHTSPDKRLSLLVEGLDIQKDCGNAGVTIVDIATLRSKIICEVTDQFGFTSDSNELAFGYINYQTTLPDFTVSWLSLSRDTHPAECAEVFNNPPQLISMDDYRSELLLLPSDTTCHVLLTLPPGEAVLLVVKEFSLPDSVCERHYLEVEDLDTLRYDRYCEAETPFAWKSDGNEVMIRFAKTENVSSMSIVVSFTSIPKPQTAECSKVLTADAGDLQSVNYPSNYPTDIGCQTLIHTQTDNRVQIVFNEFELEEETRGAGCNSDYLRLTDLATGHTTTICGLLRPFIWSSLSNEVLLEFTSDSSNTFPGYSAYYTILPRMPEIPGCNEVFISDTGTIQSPNNASSIDLYGNDQDCSQLIMVEPSQHVILSFSILNMERDPNCHKDFIELTDAVTGDTDVYCGEMEPFTWVSNGNEVVVKFHTDSENRYQGYRATFKAVANEPFSSCDVSLSSATGTIQSPAFPSQYANNLHCVTKVTVEEHYLIQIVFAVFNLEDSASCSYDYVELRTQGIGAPVVYCGIKSPFSWLSAGNVATVTFHTDFIVSSTGFKADYELVSKPDQLKACDESLSAPNGTLSSPMYPDAYPSNKDCRITITAQPGYVIQITFAEFSLEYHETCKYDYVLLSNYPEGPKDKYCGTLEPFNWVSKNNQVVVEFHSDASTRLKGYTAHYVTYPAPLKPSPTENLPAQVSKCNIEMTADQGVVTSPNFPYKYDNDMDCRTEIEADAGTRINITFHFMDIEEHRGCQWDKVEVLDLVSGRKSEPFCGSLFGGHRSWQSDSNHIVVIFVSDDIVTRIGFYATYTASQANKPT